jgi:hypothetical protein
MATKTLEQQSCLEWCERAMRALNNDERESFVRLQRNWKFIAQSYELLDQVD